MMVSTVAGFAVNHVLTDSQSINTVSSDTRNTSSETIPTRSSGYRGLVNDGHSREEIIDFSACAS
jgi:hypothetical protein